MDYPVSVGEIVNFSQSILQKIDESEGEIDAALQALLDQLDLTVASKVDSYKTFMDLMENNATFFKCRANYMTDIRKRCENVKDRVKERIKYLMIELKTDEIKGHEFKFKLSKGANILKIDQTKLPEEYFTEKTITTKVPDQGKIEADMAMGDVIPGVCYERPDVLRISANTATKKAVIKGKKQ